MNPKIILITYLNNGNFQSQVAKELLFNRIIEDLVNEGREVAYTAITKFDKRVRFEDGTKVTCLPFSQANRGMKATHIYMDEELTKLPNGQQAVYEMMLNNKINSDIGQYDLSDKDRVFTFSINNGQVDLKNI